MKQLIVLFTFILVTGLSAAEKPKMVSLNVTGMTCESCAGTVEKALKKVDGVKEVKVDLKNKKATVTVVNAKTTTAGLIKAVSDAGFDASEAKGTSVETKKGMKSGGEECDGACCGDEGDMHSKPAKKKAEAKKS
jgi:mercuric transport protein